MQNNRLYQWINLFFRFIFNLGWTALWLFGLAVLGWLTLRGLSGDRLWPVRLVNYLMPWLLVGLAPGLMLTVLARRKWLALVLAGPTLFILTTYAPLFLPRGSVAVAGNQPLKVMSFNVWAGNEDPQAIAQVIRQEQPDLILLQELTTDIAAQLPAYLADLYPNSELHMLYERRIGQAVFSRYPLTPLESILGRGRVHKVTAHLPGGPVAVWNVHPSQPIPYGVQFHEIYYLAQDVGLESGPLIVGGDFNTTDQSEAYALISRYLNNAHWDAGWGFGFSFPSTRRDFANALGLPPLVRIDHIFFSPHFYAQNARTLEQSGGSDHFPVVTELQPIFP
jgi:endonuclease/exonuclease/phosphatase (EEP) superfamily protein YafD